MRKFLAIIFTLVILSCLTTGLLMAAPEASNGTIVVATSSAADKIKVVGTSTITVMDGTTVEDVKARLVAKDGSSQTYVVTDPAASKKQLGLLRSVIN